MKEVSGVVRTLRKQVFDIMMVQRTMLEHYDGGLVVLEWTPYSMPAVGDVMIVHPSLLWHYGSICIDDVMIVHHTLLEIFDTSLVISSWFTIFITVEHYDIKLVMLREVTIHCLNFMTAGWWCYDGSPYTVRIFVKEAGAVKAVHINGSVIFNSALYVNYIYVHTLCTAYRL